MGKSNLRLLQTIPGISKLTFNDQQFFYTIFPKDTIRYSQSWLYILRVSRDDKGSLGYKFVSSDLVAVIGFRNNVFYVMPVSDETNGVALEKLYRNIFEKTQRVIIIRKIHSSEKQEKGITEDNILEDDSTPEKILQLNRLFTSSSGAINPAAINFIKKVKTFEHLQKKIKIVETLHKVKKEQIKSFLRKHPNKRKSYLTMINYLLTQKNNQRYEVMVFLDKEKIQGLYIGEIFSLKEMGIYCGLTAKEFPGATEWMDVHFFRWIFQKGIERVYLGGSETIGVSKYIEKLLPFHPSYFINTLLFDGKKKRKKDFSVVIRKIQEDDINRLADLYRTVYNSIEDLGETWTNETARQFISYYYTKHRILFFVAEYKKVIVGAIVAELRPWWDGNRLVWGEIFVDPKYRRKGIGKNLLKHLFTCARNEYNAVSWEMVTHNVEEYPLQWYKKIGFEEVPYWKVFTGDIHTVLKRLG